MVDLATPDELVLPEDDAGGTTEPLTDLLELVMVKALEGMSGRVYGLVDTYDAASGRVSITPLVPVVVDGVANAFPKLPSVPVEWPQSGTHSYKFPIAAGAIMTLSPLSHDHSRWLTAGTAGVPPTDERRFSLADLVARPWAPSPTATPPSPLSYDAAEAVLFGAHKVGDSSATELVALASLVLTELQGVKAAFDNHVHSPGTYTTPSGPVTLVSGVPSDPITQLPKPMPAPGSVACTLLKAK